MGFNHSMVCLAVNIAQGTEFWGQNTEAVGWGVLTEESRPEGYIDSQAQHQHAIIKPINLLKQPFIVIQSLLYTKY